MLNQFLGLWAFWGFWDGFGASYEVPQAEKRKFGSMAMFARFLEVGNAIAWHGNSFLQSKHKEINIFCFLELNQKIWPENFEKLFRYSGWPKNKSKEVQPVGRLLFVRVWRSHTVIGVHAVFSSPIDK